MFLSNQRILDRANVVEEAKPSFLRPQYFCLFLNQNYASFHLKKWSQIEQFVY